jgi:VRR-NUC domain
MTRATGIRPAGRPIPALQRAWRDFELAVMELLDLYRWRWVHFRPARTVRGWRTAYEGASGFPDIVAVKNGQVLFVELKSGTGRLEPDQVIWAVELGMAPGVEHCVLTPDDLASGRIEAVLRGMAPSR